MQEIVTPINGGLIASALTEDGLYAAHRPGGATESCWYKVYEVKIKANPGYRLAEAKLTRRFTNHYNGLDHDGGIVTSSATPETSQVPYFRLRLDDDGWYRAETRAPQEIHGIPGEFCGLQEYRYVTDDVDGHWWEAFVVSIEAIFETAPITHTHLILRSSASGSIIRSSTQKGVILRDD